MTNHRRGNMTSTTATSTEYPKQFNLGAHSTLLTVPARVSHHYIKRSSQLSSPQVTLPQPRSPISSTSASSCCTTTSVSSSSYFNHPEPTNHHHHYPTPLDASAIFHPYAPPPPVTQPINMVFTSSPLSQKQPCKAPSQSTHLSHIPIQPVIQKPHLNHFVPHLPPPYTLNLPTPQIHLDQAMKSEVVDRFGRSVKFENLIDRDFKTLIIFIRHFRCGYSQRYIKRLSQIANGETEENEKKQQQCQQEPSNSNSNTKIKRSTSNLNSSSSSNSEILQKITTTDTHTDQELHNFITANGVKIVIIGHGNYHLIESYKKILNCPFPIYTDLSKDQRVYKLLGMNKMKDLRHQSISSSSNKNVSVSLNLQTTTSSNSSSTKKSKSSINPIQNFAPPHNEPLIRKGESKFAFLSQVIYNAWRMPWKWSGDPQQLGGEIIFEPIREEKLIKRKPIKHKLFQDLLSKSNSIRSNCSLATNTTTTTTTVDEIDSSTISRSSPLIKRPSCSIKNSNTNNNRSIHHHSNLRKNFNLIKDSAKEIQIQCKFIHQMTNFQDHFSIDELMMQSGIRLTSLIQKY